MTKGYIVEARLTNLGDVGHTVTGFYRVGGADEASAEERLVGFLSGIKGEAENGITARVVREMTTDEVAKIDLQPTQIRQIQ